MAELVIKNQRIVFDGLKLEGQANAVAIQVSAEELNRTDLSGDWTKRAGGLKDAALSAAGFYDGGVIDKALFDAVGAAGRTIIVSQPQAAEGVIAYFMQAIEGDYQPFGNATGELAEFELNAASNGVLVRGKLAADRTITETVALAYQALQSVQDGRKLYAAVAITRIEGAGAALTVDIEHAGGDAISFAALDSVGAWFGMSDEETAQTQFRPAFTVAGAGAEFDVVVAIGVY